jgi:hypothetical protein
VVDIIIRERESQFIKLQYVGYAVSETGDAIIVPANMVAPMDVVKTCPFNGG